MRTSLADFLLGIQRSLAKLQGALASLPTDEQDACADAAGAAFRSSTDHEHDVLAMSEPRLALLYSVTEALAHAASLSSVAPGLLQKLAQGLDWDVGEVWAVDGDERVAHCVGSWSRPGIQATTWPRGPHARGTSPRDCAAATGHRAWWTADLATDRLFESDSVALTAGMHGLFHLPIVADGETRAVLRLACRSVRPVDDSVVEFLTRVGMQLAHLVERERLASKLRRAAARGRALLENSLDGVVAVDERGRAVEFNPAAEALFGLRRNDVLGQEVLTQFVPAADLSRITAALIAVRGGGATPSPICRFETSGPRCDGDPLSMEVVLHAGDGQPTALWAYFRNTTARKQAESRTENCQRRLRSLTSELLLAEELERRRLACDLHDGLGQTIALAHIKLSVLRRAANGKLGRELDDVDALIEHASRAARATSFELSPPVLHDLGLEPAIQWLVEHIQERYGLSIRLEDDGCLKPTDESTRVILFRSVRELLINAAKHSRASHVDVRIHGDRDGFGIDVVDDGVGMDPRLVGVKGHGLFSIHERVSHVGGSMQIDSGMGRGTSIHLRAPIARVDARQARGET